MKTLNLNSAIRPGGSNKTERQYFDFVVSGQSLKQILGIETADFITLLGWINNKEHDKHVLNVFRLKDKSELTTGRVMLYVCPECGDVNCGAITVSIQDLGDKIVWKDFGYETDYGGVTEEYTNIQPIEFERQSYFLAFQKFNNRK